MWKKRRKLIFSDHHIIPKCNEEKWFNVYNPNNIKRITHKTHCQLHDLFTWKHPYERLQMIYWLDKNVLWNTAKQLIEALLLLDMRDFYKPEFLNWYERDSKEIQKFKEKIKSQNEWENQTKNK